MNNKKKKEEEVARPLGLDLENIEQVELKGKEFFKFVDPKTGQIRIIQNLNDEANLSEQFKKIQQNYSFAQRSDGISNANAIFASEAKHSRIEASLIPISQLCTLDNNTNILRTTSFFNNITVNLKPEQKLEAKHLLQASKALDLKYINLENGFAIDNQNRVISSTYNSQTKKCDLDVATTIKFQNDKKMVDENDFEIQLDRINFDAVVNEIELSNDTPIVVAGEEIRKSDIEKYYNFPELLQREQMAQRRRVILDKLLQVYIKRNENTKENNKENTKQNQLVLTKPYNGFIDQVLFVLLVGFASGVIMTLFFVFLKFKLY